MSQWLSKRLLNCFSINTSLPSSRKQLSCSIVIGIVKINTFQKSCFHSTESWEETGLSAWIFYGKLTIAKRCFEANWPAWSYHAWNILIPFLLSLDLFLFPFEDYFVHICLFFSIFPLQKQYMLIIGNLEKKF